MKNMAIIYSFDEVQGHDLKKEPLRSSLDVLGIGSRRLFEMIKLGLKNSVCTNVRNIKPHKALL